MPAPSSAPPASVPHRLPKRDTAKPVDSTNDSVISPHVNILPSHASHPPSLPPASTDTAAVDSAPSLSSNVRVATHQQPLLDALKELVRERGVGHWQGLTTEGRKEVAQQLCRDHLFNPQPGNGKDSRTTVQWTAKASWTDYDVVVTCTRHVSPYYQGDVFVTAYSAHFDQVGRLVQFEERDSKSKKNCVLQ